MVKMSILPQNKGLKAGAGLWPSHWLTQDCLLCGDTSVETSCVPPAVAPQTLKPGCPQCALPRQWRNLRPGCLIKPPHYDATLAAYGQAFPLE